MLWLSDFTPDAYCTVSRGESGAPQLVHWDGVRNSLYCYVLMRASGSAGTNYIMPTSAYTLAGDGDTLHQGQIRVLLGQRTHDYTSSQLHACTVAPLDSYDLPPFVLTAV
jgi:hypothetical protein